MNYDNMQVFNLILIVSINLMNVLTLNHSPTATIQSVIKSDNKY